jgi:hypothetical protein
MPSKIELQSNAMTINIPPYAEEIFSCTLNLSNICLFCAAFSAELRVWL